MRRHLYEPERENLLYGNSCRDALDQRETCKAADPIVTESTSNSTVKTETDTTTTVKSAPPSAISPSIGGSNSDLCTVGVSGAVQTQILGVSTGQTGTPTVKD